MRWQEDKFMVFCNVKKICWELLEHLNFLSCSMVTNKNQEFVNQPLIICKKQVFTMLQVIVNDTNVMRLPLSLQTILHQLFAKQSNS